MPIFPSRSPCTPTTSSITTYLVFEHTHDRRAPPSHYRFSKLHSIHATGADAAQTLRSLVPHDPPASCSTAYFLQHHWMDWVYDGYEASREAKRRKPLGQGYQFLSRSGKVRSLWYQADPGMRMEFEDLAEEGRERKRVRGRWGSVVGIATK